MNLTARIARVKQTPFEDAFRAVAADLAIEIADSFPCWISCPIHGPERTPSLKIDLEYWYCHACKQGSDVLDFLVAIEGLSLPDAVARLEALLGLSDDPAEAAAAQAHALEAAPSRERELAAWARAIEALEAEVLEESIPLLRSPDPVILGIAKGPVDWVFEELHDAVVAGPPLVSRTRRERLGSLRRWSMGTLSGIYRAVVAATGRDRGDIEGMATGISSARIRAEYEAIRPLQDALRRFEARCKRTRARPLRS